MNSAETSTQTKKNLKAHHQLTHWGRVVHKYVIKLSNIGSDNGLLPALLQAIIWNIFDLNHFSEIKRNSHIFIQEYEFENVICEMGVILFQPQCVTLLRLSDTYCIM